MSQIEFAVDYYNITLVVIDEETALSPRLVTASPGDTHPAREEVFLHSPPSIAEFLNKVASQIPAKWRLFAHSLDLNVDLDGINQKHPQDPTECFMTVFLTWKKSQSLPFTWETVVKVLQSPAMGEMEMAEEITHHDN